MRSITMSSKLLHLALVLLIFIVARGHGTAQTMSVSFSHAWCSCNGQISASTAGCPISQPVKIYRYMIPWEMSTRVLLASGSGDQSIVLSNLCPGTYHLEAFFEIRKFNPDTGQPTGQIVERIVGQQTVVIEGPSQFLDVTLSGFSGGVCGGTGFIDATITGGNGGNTIVWKKNGTTIPGANGTHLGNLDNGTYTITVTDSKGCTKTASFTISGQNPAINFGVSVKPSGCNGPNTGEIEITGLAGTSNFAAFIQPQSGNKVGDRKWINVNPGTYSVKVIDLVTGCEKTIIVTIAAVSPVDFTANVANSGCQGPNSGSIVITPTSGNPPYSYSWSHDSNLHGNSATDLEPGQYTVTVTDSKGCTKTQTFTISQTPSVDFTLNVHNYKENGACKARICVTNLSGTAPFTYSWSCDGSTDACVTKDVLPATCTVTVTDANGCKKTQTVTAHPCGSIYTGGGVGVYPNPNAGFFTASVSLDVSSFVKIDVLDQNFTVVYHDDKGVQPAGTNNYPIDISAKPNGMYFLLITVDNVPPAEAILVQKQ